MAFIKNQNGIEGKIDSLENIAKLSELPRDEFLAVFRSYSERTQNSILDKAERGGHKALAALKKDKLTAKEAEEAKQGMAKVNKEEKQEIDDFMIIEMMTPLLKKEKLTKEEANKLKEFNNNLSDKGKKKLADIIKEL